MHQSSECHVVYHKMPGNSVASTETFLLAVIFQNPLSSLTAVYDTDAAVLDAAVSHVTRFTATVHRRQWHLSITIERQPYVTVNDEKSVVTTMVSSPLHNCNSIV